ncbi:MAG TPA: flagellar hook-length control protein FliK [Pirellulales bacterium]|jgi:flagellar hook-length control protein FliK|nr:flagellar hook-length control protein FliK [Pirellulales bacterium]
MSNASLNNLFLAPPPLLPANTAFPPITVESRNFDDALWRAGQPTTTSVTTDDVSKGEVNTNDRISPIPCSCSESSDPYPTATFSTNDSSTIPSIDDRHTDIASWREASGDSRGLSNNRDLSIDHQGQSNSEHQSARETHDSAGPSRKTEKDQVSKAKTSDTSVVPNSPAGPTPVQSTNSGISKSADSSTANAVTPARPSNAIEDGDVISTTMIQPIVGSQQSLSGIVAVTNAATGASQGAGTSSGILASNGVSVQPTASALDAISNIQVVPKAQSNLAINSVNPAVPNSTHAAASQPAPLQPTGAESAAQPNVEVEGDAENSQTSDVALPELSVVGLFQETTPRSSKTQLLQSNDTATAQTVSEELNSTSLNEVDIAIANLAASVSPPPKPGVFTQDSTNDIQETTEKLNTSREVAANKPASLPAAPITNSIRIVGANLPAQLSTGESQGGTAATATQRNPANAIDQARFVERVATAFRNIDDQGGEIRLRLSPPELGSLKVEVAVRNGILTARLETETNTARSLLLDNLPALRERLAAQNIKVEWFDVDLRQDARNQGSPNSSPDFAGSRQNQPRFMNANRRFVTSGNSQGAQTSNDNQVSTVDTGTINIIV